MTAPFIDHLTGEILGLKQRGLYKVERVITSPQAGTIAVADGGKVLNFCANNYLGLADHPDLVAAAKNALDHAGLLSSLSVHGRSADPLVFLDEPGCPCLGEFSGATLPLIGFQG